MMELMVRFNCSLDHLRVVRGESAGEVASQMPEKIFERVSFSLSVKREPGDVGARTELKSATRAATLSPRAVSKPLVFLEVYAGVGISLPLRQDVQTARDSPSRPKGQVYRSDRSQLAPRPVRMARRLIFCARARL